MSADTERLVLQIIEGLERSKSPHPSIWRIVEQYGVATDGIGPKTSWDVDKASVQQALRRLRRDGRVVAVGYGAGTRYYLSEAEATRRGINPDRGGELPPVEQRYGRKYLEDRVLLVRVLDAMIRLSQASPSACHTVYEIQSELASAWHETYDVPAIQRILKKPLQHSVEYIDTLRHPGYRLSQRGRELWAHKRTTAPFL